MKFAAKFHVIDINVMERFLKIVISVHYLCYIFDHTTEFYQVLNGTLHLYRFNSNKSLCNIFAKE